MERQVSIRLPDSLLREIDKRARRRKRRRSDVIREALKRFFDLPEAAFDVPPIERVRDLIGSVKGGPHDLASNPRYLDNLGRGHR